MLSVLKRLSSPPLLVGGARCFSRDLKQSMLDAEKVVGYSTSIFSLRYLLSDEVANIALHLKKLVGTRHPLLIRARKMLTEGSPSGSLGDNWQLRGLLILLVSKAASTKAILSTQRSLAEVTELIHFASLVHQDIVDLENADEALSSGNKLSVLTGDYLLAKASVGLANLGNTKVVQLMSKAIQHIAEAQFSQRELAILDSNWYNRSFHEMGSLISNSLSSAICLGNHDAKYEAAVFEFGRHVAFAYSIMMSLATSHDGVDVEKLHEACRQHVGQAKDAIDIFPPSDAKDALHHIVDSFVKQSSISALTASLPRDS